jgi:hypothetical protein
MDEDLVKALTEEIDEETLSEMPSWFRALRDRYKKRHPAHSGMSNDD